MWEIQIAARLDHCEIMIRAGWVRHNLVNKGYGVKSFVTSSNRLSKDNPISLNLRRRFQITFGKLVPLIRLVVIMRIASMNEDPCHRVKV